MKSGKAKLLKKRRMKEKRFARRWAIISIFACIVLSALLALGLKMGPGYIRSQIDFALEMNNYEKALSLSDILGTETYQETAKRIDYQKAAAAMEAGDFDGAKSMFLALGNYSDASDMARETQLRKAKALFENAEFSEAISILESISGYKDAFDLISMCKYRIAENLLSAGEFREAMTMFEALGDYEDAYEKRVQIAKDITGLSNADEALTLALGLSDEEMERLAQINEARSMLRIGWVDVGFDHTVARTQDGKALAAGDNEYGQTDVGGWSDVEYIAAGAYHTIALLKDGTVKACGMNEYGQTEVSGWTNVVKIAAGSFDTYGLTADGNILHAGYSKNVNYQGFTGLVDIRAGSYVFSGIHAFGSMVSTSSACQVSDIRGVVMADVNTGYGIALSGDGSVKATFGDLDWNDTVLVSAGGAGVMGIDLNLGVQSHWFRKSDQIDFSGIRAVCLAAGGGHHAVLTEDGRVIVFGDNDKGQADTENWKLF